MKKRDKLLEALLAMPALDENVESSVSYVGDDWRIRVVNKNIRVNRLDASCMDIVNCNIETATMCAYRTLFEKSKFVNTNINMKPLTLNFESSQCVINDCSFIGGKIISDCNYEEKRSLNACIVDKCNFSRTRLVNLRIRTSASSFSGCILTEMKNSSFTNCSIEDSTLYDSFEQTSFYNCVLRGNINRITSLVNSTIYGSDVNDIYGVIDYREFIPSKGEFTAFKKINCVFMHRGELCRGRVLVEVIVTEDSFRAMSSNGKAIVTKCIVKSMYYEDLDVNEIQCKSYVNRIQDSNFFKEIINVGDVLDCGIKDFSDINIYDTRNLIQLSLK